MVTCAVDVSAEAVKDREAAVRTDLATMKEDLRWIYNDIDKGFAEGAKNGKPVLIVLRCVPCMGWKPQAESKKMDDQMTR